MAGQKRGETDDQPFFEIERLKQDFLHQLERFAKRFEDFDFGFDPVHERHFKRSIAEKQDCCSRVSAWHAIAREPGASPLSPAKAGEMRGAHVSKHLSSRLPNREAATTRPTQLFSKRGA